jgi:hypothetical protein
MAKINRTRVVVPDEANEVNDTMEDEKTDSSFSYTMPNSYALPEKRPARAVVSSGWGAPQEERTEFVKSPTLQLSNVDKAGRKTTRGIRVIKILDAFPVAKYKRHYLNSKKRYYTCPQTSNCPLCILEPPADHGKLKASWTFVLNVVDMLEPKEVKTWTFGVEVSSSLQTLMENKEITLDDTDSYFEVCHVYEAGRTAPKTNVSFMRGRYLIDEHSIEPLNEVEIAELNEDRFGQEIVFVNTMDYLESAADDVSDSDFPAARAAKRS